MEMKLEILSRENIRPFSPTPPELKTYLLSSFDQQSHLLFYMQKVYFYNNNPEIRSSEVLKKSLSKTLVRYYPFAGRLKSSNGPVSASAAIDCNDEGVSFLEARIFNCDMSELINNLKTNCADAGIFELLFSDNLQGKDQRFNPLLSVQITHFDCGGGIAITLFLSHKLGDMTSVVNFMNDWASIARTSGDNYDNNFFSVSPRFDAAAFFPPVDEPFEYESETETGNNDSEKQKQDDDHKDDISLKRIELDGSLIARHKGIIGEKVENPTRVEVVTALIYKTLTNISKNKPTSLMQTINLRSRTVPSLPENLIGNIMTHIIGLSASGSGSGSTEEIEVWKLVAEMKKNMEIFCKKYPRKYKKPEEWCSLYKTHLKEFMNELKNPQNQTAYACNSWCRIQIYEADFGWGKPIWITIPTLGMKNLFLMMDTKEGDGIEVLVALDTNQLPDFDLNIQHLLFKS